MAFCTKCGTQLPEGAAFCTGCGSPMNAAPVAQAPAAPAYVPPVAPAPTYVPPVAPAPTYAPPAAPAYVPPVAPAYAAPTGQLHCPNCKGTNLTPVVETSVDSALTTSRGHISATRVNNTHRNYWMCGTCGNKFRNIQNLQEEIAHTEKMSTSTIIMSVIGVILFVFFHVLAGHAGARGSVYWPFIAFSTLFAVVSFCYIFVYKGRVAKMKQEAEQLQYHCFN